MAGKGIQIIVGAEYDGKQLAAAARQIEGLQRQTMTAGKKFADFGKGMQTIGKNLTMYVSLPLAAAGAAAVAFATQFGKEMSNVATLIPGQTERVSELKDELLALGPEVGKSLSDLSGGLYQVVSAFGDTADTVSILETNAKAATAGMSTTTDAINLTSAVTKAYGDTSAAAVEQVSDLALLAVRLGQTTFPELAASIGRVTPLAAELGVTQEELFASMATLTGVTGGAAEVSTQLRGALQALLAPTADTTKAFEAAGIESGKALLQQEGLAGAIQFLVDAANNSGQPLQRYIGSIEGQTVALALAGAQGDDYVRKLSEMQRAQGTTNEAFDAATTGVGETAFTFEQLRVEGEALLVNLGDGIAPALMTVIDALRPVIDQVVNLAGAFADLDPGMQAFIVFATGAVVLLGPALMMFGSLVKSVQALHAALVVAVGSTNALKVALISSGVGAAIVAIASVIGALAVSNSQADSAIRDFNDSIRDQNGLLRENAVEMARKRLEELGYLDIARELGINQYDLAEAYAQGGDALDPYIERVRDANGLIFDQAGALGDLQSELIKQRDVTIENAEANYEFAKQTDEAKREINEFKGRLDAQRNALSTNEGAVDGNTDAYSDLNKELDDAIDRFLIVNGLLDDTRAILDYEQAWTDFSGTIEESGISFDGTTEAGQAFQRSLAGLVENLTGVLDTQEAVGREAQIVEDAIRDLDAEVNLMGMDEATRAELLEPFQALITDLDNSGVNVEKLQRMIDRLTGKTVTIKVLADYTGLPPGISKEDLVGIGMATGGLVRGRGGPMSDQVPAMLSNGEFVIRSQAVDAFGPGFFDALNRGINPLAGMEAPRMSDRGGSTTRTMVIENINVTAASNEPAEVTVPRALRRLAWVSGLDG